MTIDERLDRLTVRQEALDRSLEMLRDRTAETAANLGRLEVRLDRLGERVDVFVGQVQQFTTMTQINFDRLTTAMLALT